jgi:hypothetical protein
MIPHFYNWITVPAAENAFFKRALAEIHSSKKATYLDITL